MLRTGDTILKIDNSNNEIIDVSVITKNYNWLALPIVEFENGSEVITQSRISINNLFRYEKLTKDHEQRYKEFLHKQTINNWFANKEFSFEEKEAIYISFNAILATKNNIAENELGKDMIQSFNNKFKFFTHD